MGVAVGESRSSVGVGNVVVMTELMTTRAPKNVAAAAEATAGIKIAARITGNAVALPDAATAADTAGARIAAGTDNKVDSAGDRRAGKRIVEALDGVSDSREGCTSPLAHCDPPATDSVCRNEFPKMDEMPGLITGRALPLVPRQTVRHVRCVA